MPISCFNLNVRIVVYFGWCRGLTLHSLIQHWFHSQHDNVIHNCDYYYKTKSYSTRIHSSNKYSRLKLILSNSLSKGWQFFSIINVLSGGDSLRHFSIFASASLTREYGLLNSFASVSPGFVMFLIHSKVLSERFKPANLKISLAVSSGRAAISRYKISLYLCLRVSSSVSPNSMLSMMALQ